MRRRDDLFQRLCRARELLRADHDRPLTIRDIARDVALSPGHFTRRFEALFGETPHQFRLEARIAQAKHLLAAGQHSVTDTCFEVGFSSLGSFSSLFSRRVGVAPSAYRRQARTLVQVPGRPPLTLIPGCLTLMGLVPAHIALFEKRRTGFPSQTDRHGH